MNYFPDVSLVPLSALIEFVFSLRALLPISSLLLLKLANLTPLSPPDDPAVLTGWPCTPPCCDDWLYMVFGIEIPASFSLTFSRGCTLQPRVTLSNPQVKRLGFVSSDHAVEQTIRVWPCRELRGSRPTRWPLRSYSLTFRLSKGIAIKPLLETERRLTAESVWMLASGLRILRRSQMRTERSSDPETTWSSLVKIADVTVSWWPWNTDTEWMLSLKSHSRNVESFEEVTTRRAAGWAAVCVSSSSWPVSWCNSWPVCVSQIHASLSQPAVTAWSPPGSQSAAMTTPTCPARERSGVRRTEQSSSLSSSVRESALP